jgi:hypothetical protein
MKVPAFIVAGVLLLSGCQQYTNGAPEGGYQTADSTGINAPAGTGAETPKLIKRAELQFEVADVQAGTQALGRLARNMGGVLSYVRVASEETSSRSLPHGADSVQVLHAIAPKAQLTVRVPAERLEEFLYGAARASSFLQYSELQVDDLTLNYLESQWRTGAREAVLARASGSGKGRIDSAGLAVMDDIITNRIAQRTIDGAVRYSTVSVALTQPPVLRRSVIVNSNLEAYGLPFGQRLGAAFVSGWKIFEAILLTGAQAWALLLCIAAGWIAYRRWARRQLAQARPIA